MTPWGNSWPGFWKPVRAINFYRPFCLIQRLLHLRRENAELFREGNYEPINFGGVFSDCAIGFVRRHRDRAIIVIVPRLSSRVGFPPIGDRWQDTHVVLPAGMSNLCDAFSDREVRVENSQLKLAVAMSQLPFAVFFCSGGL